jgi:hypothetical protein
MKLYTRLSTTSSQAALWLAGHPAVVRAAMIALPAVLALAAALLTHSPAYADPLGSGGSTSGG